MQLVLGGEIGGGQIVVSAVQLHLKIGILLHGNRQIRHDVHRTGYLGRRARRLVQKIPEFAHIILGLVDLLGAEFERSPDVIIER